MATEDRHKHPLVGLREIPPDLWTRFGEVAGIRQRSAVLRDFIRWYVNEPGAKMPRRPKRDP